MITRLQLAAIMPRAPLVWLGALNEAMQEFAIVTPMRESAFLAQIAHESGECRYVLELASGMAYEGRASLGNTQPGDGPKFRGRGLMQITGRKNYTLCGQALGLNLIESPQLLEIPRHAARSAGWYWRSNSLDAFADKDQFGALTRAINGGYNGLDDRIKYWLRARKALGL